MFRMRDLVLRMTGWMLVSACGVLTMIMDYGFALAAMRIAFVAMSTVCAVVVSQVSGRQCSYEYCQTDEHCKPFPSIMPCLS